MRISALLGACAIAAAPATPLVAQATPARTITVSGTGMDHLTGAVVHSKKATATGYVQQSTEVVDLQGDLAGTVLYQVTSTVDTVHARLVNTGDQVFSGTVGGSKPVLIRDRSFRFEMNLATGEDKGQVALTDQLSGPPVKCTLNVKGTGMKEGNPTFRYDGNCIFAAVRRR